MSFITMGFVRGNGCCLFMAMLILMAMGMMAMGVDDGTWVCIMTIGGDDGNEWG